LSHIHIESFDSPEEMSDWLAEMNKTRAVVQQRTLAPEQEAITFGSYAVRFWEELVIFCEIPTLEEQAKVEDVEVIDLIREKEAQENMLWVKGYSTVCVDGEFGYNHRSVMWPITKDTFDRARAVSWSIDRLWPASGEATLEVQSAYFDLRNWTTYHPDQIDER
jgi:hypothetical protein